MKASLQAMAIAKSAFVEKKGHLPTPTRCRSGVPMVKRPGADQSPGRFVLFLYDVVGRLTWLPHGWFVWVPSASTGHC
jgi:hypothetical protein